MSPALLRLRNNRVEWRVVEEEVVALTLDGDRYLGANRTGAMLWQALATGTDIPQMLSLLAAQGATAQQATADVESFLNALRQRGLLQE
jgi:hypothetical protein